MVAAFQDFDGLDVCIQCCDLQQIGPCEARAFAVLGPSVKQKPMDFVAIVSNSGSPRSLAESRYGVDVGAVFE